MKKIKIFRYLVMILFVTITMFFSIWPQITRIDPYAMNPRGALLSPSMHHLFGTDIYGRDVFARTLTGGRTTLAISAIAVCIGILVGLPLGIIPLFSPVVIRELLTRLIDLMLAWPGLFLALALMGVLGPGEKNLVIALGVVRAPRLALLSYNTGRKMMSEGFVEAAKAYGASSLRIAWRHILPNISPAVISQLVFQFGSAVTAETALSFLGVGVLPPKPSWGNIVADGKNFLQVAPWLALLPGIVIILYVLLVNLVGDMLIDILTPKRK